MAADDPADPTPTMVRTDHRVAAVRRRSPRHRDDDRDRGDPRLPDPAFFQHVNPIDFLSGTVWSASIQPYQFGVLALVSGTLLVTAIAMIIGVPLGLLSAILLADTPRIGPRHRQAVLETIAGIPTIVLGFFAINFLSPEILKPIFGSAIGPFSALAAASWWGSSSRR